jgi:hypothetical protein
LSWSGPVRFSMLAGPIDVTINPFPLLYTFLRVFPKLPSHNNDERLGRRRWTPLKSNHSHPSILIVRRGVGGRSSLRTIDIPPQTIVLYHINPPLSTVFFGWGRSFGPAWSKARPYRVANLIQVVSPEIHSVGLLRRYRGRAQAKSGGTLYVCGLCRLGCGVYE